MKKLKDFCKNAALVLFTVVLLLSFIEMATRWIYTRKMINAKDFRKSRPKPYAESEYFSEKFVDEAYLEPGKWINPKGTRIILPDNFAGEYFNVENNLRRTTDVPQKFSRHIYLFGGSTIYCAEVPDKYTVASYLQRKLNTIFPDEFRVVNCGVTSINTGQQLDKLKDITLNENDIVCFYGGVNDALLFLTGRINGWIVGENDRELISKNLNAIQRFRFSVYQNLHMRSRFVEIFLNPFSYQVPAPLRDSSSIKKMQSALLISYNKSITSADSICRSKKGYFFNFLQPHILTRGNNTPYEKELMKNTFINPTPWLVALKYSYPVLIEANRELSKLGVHSTDLTAMFNNTQNDYYLDFCHVTEKANEQIAAEILKVINEPKK
ncbi:MAG: hypothetical protein QM734_09680 [Cyclobacteriaceae bacterium]